MSAPIASTNGGIEDPLDFLARPPTAFGAPLLPPASTDLRASPSAPAGDDDDDDVVPTSDPEEAAEQAALAPRRRATATQAERWARELDRWATTGRRGYGLASRFPTAFPQADPQAGPSSPVTQSFWHAHASPAASERVVRPARWVPPEPMETPPPLPPSLSLGRTFTPMSYHPTSRHSPEGGWTAADKGKGRAQPRPVSPTAPAAARFTPSPTPSTIEMERAPTPISPSRPALHFETSQSINHRTPESRPNDSLESILTPAPSSTLSPRAPADVVDPSTTAGANVQTEDVAPARQPSLSPRAAQELADAITRLDDPAATSHRRSFRQRTSLQLNPYTRERAAYRHLLARGGLEAAIVQRREELGAQSGGAAADGSFVPPPEKEPAAQGKVKGKGRVLTAEDRRLLESFGGPLPADEDDELDLLASVSQMGGGELARWEAAVRRRKAETKARERKQAKRNQLNGKALPMNLSQVQKENREPYKYVPPPDLLDNLDEEDGDYSAFGIHRPSAQTGSPSSPRSKRRLRHPRAPDSQSSASDSDSAQSIETDGGRARPAGLDKKRARILGRMMPAVAANRHIDQLRRAAADRERAAKTARQQASGPAGPVRAGQSVVRRAPGAAVKPLVIDGDSESDEGNALVGNESLERNSLGHHRRLDALLGHDSIDPDVVAAMYPDDGGLLSDGSADSSATVVLDDDESEEEPDIGDIRAWLKLPRAAVKAASVVDLMLNRTRAKARPDKIYDGSRGGGRGTMGPRPAKSRPAARYGPQTRNPARADVGSSTARSNGPPRPRAINRGPKQRPIVLDDDSIYGDVVPRAPAARRDTVVRRRTGTFLPRPAAMRRAAHPPTVMRNPPLFVPPRDATEIAINTALAAPARPVPLGEAALLAQGVAGPRLPAAQYAAPPTRLPSPPVRPQGLGQPEGVPWGAYESFSLDFDIRPLPAGLTFPPESEIRQGRLEDFLGLLRTSVDQLPPPLPAAIYVFGIQLDPAMALTEFQQVFSILVDQLYECTDAAGLEVAAAAVDVKRETTVLEDAWEATRFTCAFVTARQADTDFEILLFAPVFDTIDHLLERLEPLTTPTTVIGEAKLFFHLHWFALELLVRFSLVSASVAEQVKDSLLKVAEVLVRRLLEYGFNRTVKSVKTAVMTAADDGCVGDYTAELWVALVHVFNQLSAVPGALPLEATLSSLIIAASESTTLPTQGLLAAERTWYLVQGLSAISQFTAAGRVYPRCTLPAQWPLVVHAISAVKLESDPVTDRVASSTALVKRDKYVWTVLGRCHLLASRWGWRFDVQDTLLGVLCQKIFKSRGFVKLYSDPTSDFPLFLRESNQTLVEAVDPEGDSAFDVFLKLLHIAVRDFGRSAADGRVHAKQAERAVSRLLAISAPVGRTSFTRKTPPTLRELSTLINRYSFTMVAVFLSPSADNAAHSLRLSQSFLDFDAADFKSRKICIRAAMYVAVLYQHFALELSPIADWLGHMAETLLREHALVARPAPAANLTALPPLSEIVWCLSMILGSIRHIIESRGMDGQALIAYPDPALLHKSWTVGILSSSLALEPITGAEVLQCVQAFLDARRIALTSATAPPIANVAGDSQDEFAFEFAPMDFDDPSLRRLLCESDVISPPTVGSEPVNATAVIACKDKTFAEIIGHTVSPAIYRLLGNMLSGDQTWLGMIGGSTAVGSIATRDDIQAREAYIARLVDCWAGCAAVLVQHGLKDWSSYVELGTESWKRFGTLTARRQVGLRFLWNVVSLDPSAISSLREEVLSIWFQAIVAPPSTWTVEPDLTAQLITLDANEPGSLFVVTPFARRALTDEDSMSEGEVEVEPADLRAKRGALFDEIFTSISIDVSRPAAGDVALQQRKAFLISLVRDLLLSMSDFYMALEGDEKRVYALFALDIVRRLRDKSGDWLNERSVRELAYWSAVAEGMRAAAAPATSTHEAAEGAMRVDDEPVTAGA